MILTTADFTGYPKVLVTVNQDENYWLGLGDIEYSRLTRLLNVSSSDLPDEADILDEVKEILVLSVCKSVASGLIGQNVQAVSENIVVDPWQAQFDTFEMLYNEKEALIGRNHYIKDAEEFYGYTAKIN